MEPGSGLADPVRSAPRSSGGGFLMSGTRTLGEKVAVVEEQIKQMRVVADERHEEMSSKIDRIIAGQQAGADDRAAMRREVAAIKSDLGEMKPHVETVARAKTFVEGAEKAWSFAGKVGAAMTAIGGTAYAAWIWVKPYFTSRGH